MGLLKSVGRVVLVALSFLELPPVLWTHRKAHMMGQEVCHGREEEKLYT